MRAMSSELRIASVFRNSELILVAERGVSNIDLSRPRIERVGALGTMRLASPRSDSVTNFSIVMMSSGLAAGFPAGGALVSSARPEKAKQAKARKSRHDTWRRRGIGGRKTCKEGGQFI